MKGKQLLHTKKGILAIAALVAAVLAITVLVIFNTIKESFRMIKVFAVEGSAFLERDEQIFEAYEGMQLANRDTFSQKDNGYTQLLLDEDKYITVEPNTTIALHATGKEPDSNTTIELMEGIITNQLRTPLTGNSSFEVTTPAGAMVVRGTTYRITVIKNEDGSHTVTLDVFEGAVGVTLKNPDQTLQEQVVIQAGEAALIEQDSTLTEFVFKNEPIDYGKLPPFVMDLLMKWSDDGLLSLTGITKEELKALRYAPDSLGKEAEKAEESKEPPDTTKEEEETASLPKEQKKQITDKPVQEEAQSIASNVPDDPESETGGQPKSNPEPPPSAPNVPSKPDETPSTPLPPAQEVYTVIFKSGNAQAPGGVFAKCQVKAGEVVPQPSLSPDPSFVWYQEESTAAYDFGTPVQADLVLYNQP